MPSSQARAGPCTAVSRDRFLPVTQQATAGDLERFSAAYGTFRWCSCQRWRPRARRQGLRRELLDAACGYAAAAGAAVIEAYPSPDGRAYRYMGTRELYRAASFEEVPVPPNSRPVMRRPVEAGRVEPGRF